MPAFGFAVRMTAKGGMDRWVEHEKVKINKGLVTRKKKLRDLLKEENPRSQTKEGDDHEFEHKTLERLAAALLEGEEVMLPITLSFSSAVGDSCYVTDETASFLLRRLEGFGDAYPYRDGKMWLPNSMAFAIMQRYPTAFQGMFL